MRSKSEARILIIGAGFAGLSCANYLLNTHGFKEVIVLEASHRAGGRVHTVLKDNKAVELGAQYIHNKNSEIYQIAKELDNIACDRVSLGKEDLLVDVTADGMRASSNLLDQCYAELENSILEQSLIDKTASFDMTVALRNNLDASVSRDSDKFFADNEELVQVIKEKALCCPRTPSSVSFDNMVNVSLKDLKFEQKHADIIVPSNESCTNGDTNEIGLSRLMTNSGDEIQSSPGNNTTLRNVFRHFLHHHARLLAGHDYGCPSHANLSFRAVTQYDCGLTENEDDHVYQGQHAGYQRIIDHLLGRLRERTDDKKEANLDERTKNIEVVRYSSLVERIVRNQQNDINSHPYPLSIQLATGESLDADHVVVTSSIGYLQVHCDTIFEPKLPLWKQISIKSMGMGCIEKLLLFYDNPITIHIPMEGYACLPSLDDTCPEDSVFYLAIIQRLIHFDNALLLWISPAVAPRFRRLTDAELRHELADGLTTYLGTDLLNSPKEIVRTSWGDQEMFLGSYSYCSKEFEDNGCTQGDIIRPVIDDKNVPLILFAGEATSGSHQSTVHGAYETGVREAQRLHKFYER